MGVGALVVAAALPGLAWAHGGGTYTAVTVASPPVIDGNLGDAVWANAPSYPLTFGSIPATVRYVHTATTLYVGVTVQDLAPGASPSIGVYFDNTHNGIKDVGDDAWISFVGLAGEDFFWDGSSHIHDTAAGGSSDTVATSTSASGNVVFEISHPLCSSDSTHDICASGGSVLGVQFQYEPGTSPGVFFDAPGASTLTESDWADLTISAADATPPTVTWVQPATGGTNLSGITTLSVNAADDVGVDHVTFEYYDGSQTYALGTDSTAPYSIQFNTLAFPDRPTNSATVYAQAFDAAGNSSLRTGVGVGINNGQTTPGGGGTVHGAIDIDTIFVVGMTPNTVVTGTVNGTTPWQVTTDGNGQGGISSPVNLVPGSVITANDGVNHKSVTLVPIHISSVNYAANTASGTGPGAGDEIRVTLFDQQRNNLGFDFATTDSNNNWTVHFNAGQGRQVVAGDYIIADTPDFDGDRTRADFSVAPDQWAVSISGPPSSQAGVGSVALTGPGAVPPNLITGVPGGPPGTGLGGIGLGGIGLGGIGLGGIGLGGITINKIGLGGIGLGGIGLGGIGLGGIGLGGIGLTPDNLTQNGLGGVPLSDIPLKAPDSWQNHLNRVAQFLNAPPQSVTLAQVIGNPTVMSGVTLGTVNLAGTGLGGIGLGGIGLGGIGLGGIGLGGIGLGGIPTTAQNLAAWCTYINHQPGFQCLDTNSLANTKLMDITLQGVGLGGIPFEQIGLGGIDLTGTGLGGIPIGTGLGGIGLGGIDLTGTGLGGIGLGGINWTGTGLGGIGLGGIGLGGIPAANKALILNCPTAGGYQCPAGDTLADAFAHGAINPSATVQDIGYYCVAGPSTVQATWCQAGDKPILMQDFVKNLPPDTKLSVLLGSLLPRAAYDWEQLPLQSVPLQDYSNDGGVVTYTVTFSVNSASTGSRSASVVVKLPEGADYFAGSATSTATLDSVDPQFNSETNKVTWSATFAPNTQQTLTFKVKPGIELGNESATAELFVNDFEIPSLVASSSPTSTAITQTWPGNGAATSPQTIAPDKLYLGYTPNGTDRDYFSLPLPDAGTKVTVHLGHLKVDEDLVVYAPTVDPLRVPKPSTTGTLAPEVEPSLQHRSQPITPEVLNDVPLTPPAGQSLVAVSDNRNLEPEDASFIVPEHSPGATATIQVTSYGGGHSNDPWSLRVEESPIIPLPTACSATPLYNGTRGTTQAMPKSVGGSTLYLFNSKRFGDIYGGQAETDVLARLTSLAGRSDAAGGTVVPIDAVSSIATPLNAWYSNACSPGAANDVVRAIGRYLDTLPTTYKYVVLVGGFDVIPPGLVADNTSYVNEREYATTFYGASNNQYLAAYALGYLPTDDVYGDTNYSGSGAYVPEVPVGRLIETPSQIMGQIDKYTSPAVNGAINPTTALVTGYDFLSDGATQVASALQPKVPAPVSLISDSWTRLQLFNNLFPSGGQIDVINAHYDHQRLLPAAENQSQSPDLFTTADLQATTNRLVITLGCHSGVSVADGLFSGLGTDWAQTYAAQGAIDYIGNTGFGLGETAGVAYSEQLQVLLAQRLDGSMTVGQALAFAKQEYAGSVPTTSGYQLKVINEASLYGLPMYRLTTGTPPTGSSGSGTPLPITTDPVSGLAASSFTSSPSYSPNSATTGTYYTSQGSAAYENRRPIEPLVKIDVTQPNLVAHGALLTALTSSDSATPINAAFSRVVDDLTSLAPELGGDVIYPSKLQSITTFAAPTGTRQRLLLFGGQFRGSALTAGTNTPVGIGTQRLFNSFGGLVLYGGLNATDFEAPTFGPVAATSPASSSVAFAVDVTDNLGADNVKRVVALYRDSSNTWRSIDLARSGATPRWSGTGAFGGGQVEWFIQAADGSGNVGVTSNKADLETPISPTSNGLTITLNPTVPTSGGWFNASVAATISGGSGISYSLDGAAFASGTQTTIAGTGVHILDAQSSDGSTATAIVPIDVTPPTVSITGVTTQNTPPVVTCNDAGSGVAACTVGTLDTTTLGTHTVHVHAVDKVGNVTDVDKTYFVDKFTGFLQPVDNPPIVNVASGGSSIPVKFSLGVNAGLNVIQVGYPIVQQVACGSNDPLDTIEQTVTANASSLSYDAGSNTYNYVWKTQSAWAGTCRQFILVLTDGTQHIANFKFK